MNRLVAVLLVLLVIVTAFASSLGYLYASSVGKGSRTTMTRITSTIVSTTTTLTEVKVTNTFTSTSVTNTISIMNVTYAQLSGNNYSVFYVTEVVVVRPEFVNDICVGFSTNQTISSTYYLPSQFINATNPIGFVTTSVVYENESAATRYNNITGIYNGTTTCTEINPYYNVTQTGSGSCACV